MLEDFLVERNNFIKIRKIIFSRSICKNCINARWKETEKEKDGNQSNILFKK